MDTVRRRRCETCVFHQPGPTACTGICRNTEWQPMTDAIRFVRDRELACYRGWGVDYWRPKNGSAPLGGDVNGAPSGSGGLPGHRGSNRTLVGMPIIQLIPVDATSAEPIDYVHSIEWNDDAGSVT